MPSEQAIQFANGGRMWIEGPSVPGGQAAWSMHRLNYVLIVVAHLWMALLGRSASVTLEINSRFASTPLVFDIATNVTQSNQKISITRLDFLLSKLALRRADGIWVEKTNWFAYLSARERLNQTGRAEFSTVRYDRIRFLVGVEPAINHQDIAAIPANHPLNPEINGLHWNWKGGYVFCALEGNWLRPNGIASGYSYHFATDVQLMTVELPIDLGLAQNVKVELALNTEKILDGIKFSDETSSTHSRASDTLATLLKRNVEHAFALERIQNESSIAVLNVEKTRFKMASNATPHRFQMSGFFPQPALPKDNPLTEEGVALGKRLFFEKQLSRNDVQACASCHDPASAFTDGHSLSRGADGLPGKRNAMSLLNLAWKTSFFWDGRAASLREQVLQPIQNPIEMHASLADVVTRLQTNRDYPELFAKTFGTSQITADRIARALEQFLLTQTSFDSKFDRVIAGAASFTVEEQRGFDLFHTEYDPHRGQRGADCFHCHGGPLFQSQSFANNGLDAAFTDAGRFAVTGCEGDQGRFAVPSLRNVELTAPYMHDGRITTLEDSVEHYCTGMKRSATLDPNLGKHPDGGLPLSQTDKSALVAFLKTLTDERFHRPVDPAIVQSH